MSSRVSINDAPEVMKRRATQARRTVVMRPPRFTFNIVEPLARLWQYRDLFYSLSQHRIKVRYKQSVLGIAWAVLQPLSLMLIYTVIFSFIARMPSDGKPYALFAYTALLIWTYFSTALTNATNALVSHANLVTKVYFPREIIPLTYIVAALFDFLIASVVLTAMMIYYGVEISLNVVYVVPIIFIVTCFSTACALFFSATQVRFRDIGVAMPLVLQLWMFATPVVYPLSALDKFPAWLKQLYALNPMVGLVENFRRVVLGGEAPDVRLLVVSAGVSFVLLTLAYLYFKRVEATIADVI